MDTLMMIKQAEDELKNRFSQLEEIAYLNQKKVLDAFRNNHLREYHFNTSSGYGYGDAGRELLDLVFAQVLGTEDALVRTQIVSGTHAISACLFATLKPGDELVCAAGSPYDTLASIIGQQAPRKGTLVERGVVYREVNLTPVGTPDLNALTRVVGPQTKVVFVQRSRGYSLRPPLTIKDIKSIVDTVKKANPETIVIVDNCYGEFVESQEPGDADADLVAGSLIKNPGGGLALSGGYVAGKRELVEAVSFHLTAPGLGKEMGASLVNSRSLFQGLFLAPHTVLQALKGAVLIAYIFEKYGYKATPHWNETRADIVQTVQLKNAREVQEFCQVVQSSSPVDSDVKLEYALLPGYNDEVVMAAGTFIQGASIELSCDAPLRPPYCVYLQGGLTYEHLRYTAQQLVESIILPKP